MSLYKFIQKRETASSQLKDESGNLLSWDRLCRSIPSGIEASPEGTEALQLKLQGPCGLYSRSVSCVLLPLATNGHPLRSGRDSLSPRMTAYKNGGVLRLLDSFSAVSKYFIRTLDSIRVLELSQVRVCTWRGLADSGSKPSNRQRPLSSQSCLNVVGNKVRERELVLRYNGNSHTHFVNSQNPITSTILL